MKKIQYGRQNITEDDISAVVEVLKSDYLTQGPKIKEFEDAFANYVGSKFAVAVSNGTAALHLCALALDVNDTSNVITTPITFAATANCVRYCRGNIFFADIESSTYILDIKAVELLINSKPKGFFKGIIPVDFAGYAVDLEAFRKLADEHGLWIIEDACHAPGGFFTDSKGIEQKCGNGNFADLSIFSFHPVKHITAGEGGMITTNNEKLYHKLRNLRTHGIQQIPELRKFNHGIWYYEMQELGFNYRLSDIQAALGKSQLKRASAGLERRWEIAACYTKAFSDKKFIKRQLSRIQGHAYHLYVVEFDDRNGLINYLRDHGIFAQVHYIPLHLMPYYQDLGWKERDFPVSENYYKSCLSLPMFPTLTQEDLDYVINMVNSYYES
jgi:UDP-4-amino-4,6-dideoxy-N-acetyl-beta-L-altrosamine transaminase